VGESLIHIRQYNLNSRGLSLSLSLSLSKN
jgi:hypothetical protein